jgi:hypothetical protein
MVHNPTEFHLLSSLDTDKKTEAKYKLGFRAPKILYSFSHILTKKQERKKRNINNIRGALFFSNVIAESCVNVPQNSRWS